MKSYLEGFVIAVFTIVSTIFFLGFFLSSSSPSNGSFTNIEPKIEGDDFIVDTGLGSEKLRVVNLVPRDSLSGHSCKENMADFMVQHSVLSSALCEKLSSQNMQK